MTLPLRAALALVLGTCGLPAAGETIPRQIDFIRDLQSRHGFDIAWLESFMTEARHDERVISAISRPAETLPWHRYRSIFITDQRIRDGVKYWRRHEQHLLRAERLYGVPPQLIVAILGVETLYGTRMGKYRVADALVTLGFGYPKRADFFRDELENFLLLSREEGFDPLALTGSYAGAMGKPQFIASSYRRFAVDADGDGKRDLFGSDADAIGSVANYFAEHGWRPGEPVVSPVSGNSGLLATLADGGSKPTLALSLLKEKELDFRAPLNMDRLAVVIGLDDVAETDYWLGFDNFYAITRYNHSNLYAMAVYQLSKAILEMRTADKENQG